MLARGHVIGYVVDELADPSHQLIIHGKMGFIVKMAYSKRYIPLK